MRRVLLTLGLVVGAAAAAAQPRAVGAPVPFGPEGYLHATVSPTGDRVLLTTESYAGLWAVDAAGRGLRQLSDAPAVGFGAAWSPDGTSVAARAARVQPRGNRLLQLVLFDLATGAETALTEPQGLMPSLPRFSPDGASVWIAAEAGPVAVPTGRAPVAAASEEAVVVGPSGVWTGPGSAFRLPVANAQVLRAVPSPDGRRVAVELYGGDLYVTDADGSNAVSLGRGEAPAWRPDGAYVAFMVTEDDGYEITGADLIVASADGQRRAALTRTAATAEMYPAWLSNDTLLYDDVATGRVMRLPLADN